jgi:hypothetical protein
VLYCPLPMVHEQGNLRVSYRFLSGSGPAPRLPHGFLYQQPGAVAAPADTSDAAVLEAVAQNADLFAQPNSLRDRLLATVSRFLPGLPLHELQQPPNWASAAQRYVETVALEQLRRNATDVLLSKAPAVLDKTTTVIEKASDALGHVAGALDKTSGALRQMSGEQANDVVQRTLSDIQKVVGNYMKMPR